MPELHKLLTPAFNQDPLVRYAHDVVPALLSTFFGAVSDFADADARERTYKKIFPILIERVFQLFPTTKTISASTDGLGDTSQSNNGKLLELFGAEIKKIAETYPDVVYTHSTELLSFLSLFQTCREVQHSPCIVNAVLHSIGDAVSRSADASAASPANTMSHDNATLLSYYNTLEELVYEAVQQMSSSSVQDGDSIIDDNTGVETNVLSNLTIVQSLLATICKIAAHAQELIQRAIVCLNKVINFEERTSGGSYGGGGTSNSTGRAAFTYLRSYAQELTNILQKPQVAPAVLCGRSAVVPWHLSADSALMLKIHMLSYQVDVGL